MRVRVLLAHTQVTVGSDLDAGDDSYLMPTSAYSWKVIALNYENRNCRADGVCDGNLLAYGTGWSGPPSALGEGTVVPYAATQDNATPDMATGLGFGGTSQSSLTLTWTPPNDNGSPLGLYSVVCTDAEPNYVHGDWHVEPTSVTYTSADPAPASDQLVIGGLTPG